MVAEKNNDRCLVAGCPNLLGVIGHYASEVTLAAVDIYQQYQLVLISPGSTSEDLSNKSPFFFRTTSSDRNEFVKELVKVVPSSCSPDGLIFVAVSDKAENLERCRKEQ